MRIRKKKTKDEQVQLQLVLSRLRGTDTLVLNGAEPMLAVRLSALTREVELALDNSEEY